MSYFTVRCQGCGDTHLCTAAIQVTEDHDFIDQASLFAEEILATEDPRARAKVSAIYHIYEQWCHAKGAVPQLPPRRFNSRLVGLGYTKERIGGLYWWVGATVNIPAYRTVLETVA